VTFGMLRRGPVRRRVEPAVGPLHICRRQPLLRGQRVLCRGRPSPRGYAEGEAVLRRGRAAVGIYPDSCSESPEIGQDLPAICEFLNEPSHNVIFRDIQFQQSCSFFYLHN
jgi:hypothetical protein